jgi:hypothetical protein
MKKKQFVLFFILLLAGKANLIAQCAMCKTSATSDLENGGSIANGLNTGILYLMAVPYLILMIGGYFFFKKPIDAKIRNWKNKRFPPK